MCRRYGSGDDSAMQAEIKRLAKAEKHAGRTSWGNWIGVLDSGIRVRMLRVRDMEMSSFKRMTLGEGNRVWQEWHNIT